MFTSLLNKTANVSRKTFIQGQSGDVSETWATAGTYPTRYAKSTNPRVTDGQYKTTVDEFLFFFETGTDIVLEDNIEVDGKTFIVKGIYTFDDGDDAHHMEVIANIVTNS